jgi:RNA polymerase sigma factor FliA
VNEQRRILHQCVQWLPKPEQSVIKMYYYESKTLKQIAKEINRSESRAHQLHAQAIMRLSGFLNSKQGLFADSRNGGPGLKRGRAAAARK